MTTPLFPTVTSNPSYPIDIETEYFNRGNRYGKGVSQWMAGARFPVRTVKLPYGKMPVADQNSVMAFFKARRGSYERFCYIHNRQEQLIDEYVGYATGIEKTLDLPSKDTVNAASLILYADGVAISKTFSADTGENGVDQAIFTATAGKLITVDCYGLLRLFVRFDNKIKMSWFRYLHASAEILLIEDTTEET